MNGDIHETALSPASAHRYAHAIQDLDAAAQFTGLRNLEPASQGGVPFYDGASPIRYRHSGADRARRRAPLASGFAALGHEDFRPRVGLGCWLRYRQLLRPPIESMVNKLITG